MRRVRSGFVSWLVAGCLFLFGALQYAPRTAEGVQCPTVPVVTVKSCCDKVVKTFVQCRCAEKKSVAQAAAPKPLVLLPAAEPLRIATSSIPPSPAAYCYRLPRTDTIGSEAFHPPACA